MPQRYICANFDGKYRMIIELNGRKVNMFCKENCLFSLRALVKGIPARAEFVPKNSLVPNFIAIWQINFQEILQNFRNNPKGCNKLSVLGKSQSIYCETGQLQSPNCTVIKTWEGKLKLWQEVTNVTQCTRKVMVSQLKISRKFQSLEQNLIAVLWNRCHISLRYIT